MSENHKETKPKNWPFVVFLVFKNQNLKNHLFQPWLKYMHSDSIFSNYFSMHILLYKYMIIKTVSYIKIIHLTFTNVHLSYLQITDSRSSVITGRAAALQYCFYSRADFRVFRPAGATRCTDQCEIWQGGADRRSAPPCQISPWSVQGWGFTAPETEKNGNFTNIIAPKGTRPLGAIILVKLIKFQLHDFFTKFTSFMRVLSLHNSAKFHCFILISGKIINNLLRWWRFQSNFRLP